MADAQRRGFRIFLVFVAVLVCLGGVITWLAGWDSPLASRQDPETEDAYVDGPATPLAAREEGYLKRMLVDDNQPVHAGQVVAELEDDDYRASVAQAEGQLAAAQAALRELQDQRTILLLQVRQSVAQAAGTGAERVRASEEASRQAMLLPTALGERRQYDNALADDRRLAANTRAQAAQAEERRRQTGVLAAQEARASADIEARQASLDLARIRLGYTRLRAPFDGVAGTRQVRVGTLLEAGTEVIPVTQLAAVWITADFTERQLTDMHPGQAALVRLDTFPDVQLRGHVAGISPLTGQQLAAVTADNATGNFTKVVQRVPVKIVLDDEGGALRGRIRPGMSALARVLTGADKAVRPAR